MAHIESLLSARLFLVPQIAGNRIFFLSDLSGHLSLYRMKYGGSVPEPLLPPNIALQNPHLIEGQSYYTFPDLDKILIMIDKDGDENYQPMLVSMSGGFPVPAFGDHFQGSRVFISHCDPEHNIVYLNAESLTEQNQIAYQGDLKTGKLTKIGESKWGNKISGVSESDTRAILIDKYSFGDHVLYLWKKGKGQPKRLYGIPIESRLEGTSVSVNAIRSCHFTLGGGLLFSTGLLQDTFGLGYLHVERPDQLKEVNLEGTIHSGDGELVKLIHLKNDRFTIMYNIDGISWMYEGIFNESDLTMTLQYVICGQGILSDGVVDDVFYDRKSNRYIFAFSTASSPTQIYTVEGKKRKKIYRHTNERILGIPPEHLSRGEEYPFISYDGARISARLYLPPKGLGFKGSRPLVYYIHGGPQSQERPDFAWFSMPLIQFLVQNGFAVFVPNVRGSTGYGLNFAKQVDRDWGGKDRLDHVHAMTEILPKDHRLDVTRAGVIGRSYGGYMSLTLASRHPEFWKAAVDMFGPYDLLTFMDRIPETWKPLFSISVGDPDKDRDFLIERSPRTYMDDLSCPLLVIQGKNDPRVVEEESRDLVNNLRAKGKQVELLVFQNEGHDVLKYDNRVACYNTITEFFKEHLQP